MSAATNGRAREHRVRDALIAHGWTQVMRAAGSKGAGDLLMGRSGNRPLLVQVGTVASKHIGPAARDRFLMAADLIGARPVVALTAPGKPTTWLEVTDKTAAHWLPFHPEAS